jgi:hypothetical protein
MSKSSAILVATRPPVIHGAAPDSITHTNPTQGARAGQGVCAVGGRQARTFEKVEVHVEGRAAIVKVHHHVTVEVVQHAQHGAGVPPRLGG